jgi:hypothetical protein
MRDDFSVQVKDTLAKRVGYRCSNPGCRKLTAGPHAERLRAVNIGVGAHITAAAPGGPRYDATLATSQRSALLNGIWLCQSCSKLIDSDVVRFTERVLLNWRDAAEAAALAELQSSTGTPRFAPIHPKQLASVLLPEAHAGVEFRKGNARGKSIDYSVYMLVIEELITVGVSSIAIVRGSGPDAVIPFLPKFLRERVALLEPSASNRFIHRLFEPIEEEFDVSLEFPVAPMPGIVASGRQMDLNLMDALATIYPLVYKLYLGMQYGLHIELDIPLALQLCRQVRGHLHSPAARGGFAVVAGLLSAYKQVAIDTVTFSTKVPYDERTRRFAELLTSESYAAMSASAFDLGQPMRSDAVARLSDASARVLATEIAGSAIHAAHIPMQMVQRQCCPPDLLPHLDDQYFPPVVPFGVARQNAYSLWLNLRPVPLMPQGMMDKYDLDAAIVRRVIED